MDRRTLLAGLFAGFSGCLATSSSGDDATTTTTTTTQATTTTTRTTPTTTETTIESTDTPTTEDTADDQTLAFGEWAEGSDVAVRVDQVTFKSEFSLTNGDHYEMPADAQLAFLFFTVKNISQDPVRTLYLRHALLFDGDTYPTGPFEHPKFDKLVDQDWLTYPDDIPRLIPNDDPLSPDETRQFYAVARVPAGITKDALEVGMSFGPLDTYPVRWRPRE